MPFAVSARERTLGRQKLCDAMLNPGPHLNHTETTNPGSTPTVVERSKQ
jgi:hypothetical protein